MKRAIVLVSVVMFAGSAVVSSGAAAAEVAAPPAINLPAGAKVVTEVNISDEDVLGIIKSCVPAVADVLKSLAPSEAASPTKVPQWVGAVKLDEFSEAISGIRGIRLIVAQYSKPIEPELFVEQFTMGVQKSGQFNKVATDFGTLPFTAGLYVAPENAGMIGFAYLLETRTAYALRITGALDLPKLIHWAGEVARMALGTEPQPVPATETPAPAN